MERTVKEVHGSLLVTIPRLAARQLGIEKGTRMRVETKHGELILRKADPNRVLWTVGYEGESPDSLVELLRARGIQRLVDVRELPLSRRKGFSKSKLAERLGEDGIEYMHQRNLGAPKEVRKPFIAGGSFADFRTSYLAHLDEQTPALTELKEAVSDGPTAIMCVEKVHSMCHRQFIAGALQADGYEIHHL